MGATQKRSETGVGLSNCALPHYHQGTPPSLAHPAPPYRIVMWTRQIGSSGVLTLAQVISFSSLSLSASRRRSFMAHVTHLTTVTLSKVSSTARFSVYWCDTRCRRLRWSRISYANLLSSSISSGDRGSFFCGSRKMGTREHAVKSADTQTRHRKCFERATTFDLDHGPTLQCT